MRGRTRPGAFSRSIPQSSNWLGDSSQFTYLSSCQPNADVVVGDARLTLAKEVPKSFDFLLMDAFSSGAVPTHLLTVEALRLYLDKLSDRGVLVMHVSNRHLDLIPVVLAAAQQIPGAHAVAAIDRSAPQGYDKARSYAVLLTKSASSSISTWPGALPPADDNREGMDRRLFGYHFRALAPLRPIGRRGVARTKLETSALGQ